MNGYDPEQVTTINDVRIPKGFSVTYHVLRGYDSPDRWYEAHKGKRKLGDFGDLDGAVAACKPKQTR
jgi:hypothetical protein